MNCIVLMSETSKQNKTTKAIKLDVKTIKNVELRRKTFKTTQNYKNYQITWIASIWCPNDHNNAKLQKRLNYDKLHRFYVVKHSKQSKTTKAIKLDVKTIKNVELRRKTFKTTQNYKNYQITWIASIWCPNDHNNAKLQKRLNYDKLHRFYVVKHSKQSKTTKAIKLDVKTSKNVELRRKTFKTT